MDYGFTAEIEEKFDHIASGELSWTKMLKNFYFPFHSVVEETFEKAGRFSGERNLGIDPETGWSVLAKVNRQGRPMIQIGSAEEVGEEQSPKFANLKFDQSIETITLDDALKLFELPRSLGEYQNAPVEVNSGRYGPYIKFKEDYISLPRNADPFKITLEESIPLIQTKLKEKLPIASYQGIGITRGKGRFGPYLKWNNLYVNIPKRIDPETISPEQCIEMVQEKIEKEKNKYILKWDDDQLYIQNGRWGPFIRYKKKNFKLPKKADGTKYEKEELLTLEKEEVQQFIEDQAPGTFKKKKTKTKTKAKTKK